MIGVSLLFGQELLHELVVRVLEFLVHARHHADVVVVYQVHFFEIEHFR